MMFRPCVILVVWTLALAGALVRPAAAETPALPHPPAITLDQVLKLGDRVLFVGDEFTQQMFYTRAVASALLPLAPATTPPSFGNVRFYNGGRSGSTAADALQWIDELLALCRPTVVFVCFGLNDGQNRPIDQPAADAFARDLTALIARIRQAGSVRQVVVIGPPPIQAGLRAELMPEDYNFTLSILSDVARQVAGEQQCGFVELFGELARVYLGQLQTRTGEPLSLDGRLPTEQGGIIAASIVLRQLGVGGEQLDAIGWSPLLPRRMAAIRPVLALPTRVPSLAQAQRSREIYEHLMAFDEAFFRLWRLAGRRPTGPDPQVMQNQVDQTWQSVRQAAIDYPYAGSP
jgi:lysophospholipase L1-like esterase